MTIPYWVTSRISEVCEMHNMEPTNVIGLVESYLHEKDRHTYRTIMEKTREVIHTLKEMQK